MLLNILNILFAASAVSLAILIMLFKLVISKSGDNMKLSDFVAGIAVFMLLYIMLGILLIIFKVGIVGKLGMLFFVLSPFIIGKLATYKTENIFTCVQIFSIILSVVFIFYI